MAAKDICEEINETTKVRSTKRHVSYESHDEPFSDALRKLEVGVFNVVVDAATSVITERFSTLEIVGNKVWVLTNFPSLADEELAEKCNALGTTLHFEGHSDLDSRELV